MELELERLLRHLAHEVSSRVSSHTPWNLSSNRICVTVLMKFPDQSPHTPWNLNSSRFRFTLLVAVALRVEAGRAAESRAARHEDADGGVVGFGHHHRGEDAGGRYAPAARRELAELTGARRADDKRVDGATGLVKTARKERREQCMQ